ncbi:biotin--[acetyl-CoA-carboxylase] ligase [Bifidobacterium samirii]
MAAARMPLTCAAAGRSATLLFDEVDSTNVVARRLILDGGFADGRKDSGAGVGRGFGQDSGPGSGMDDGAVASAPDSDPVPPIPVAVVAADRQSAGRGRLDHAWTSRPGESFTVSFVVRVPRAVAADPQVNGWLTMIAGHAALDALRALVFDRSAGGCASGSAPDRLRLKWPNDMFCDGRKLGGILTELVVPPAASADDVAIIIGIGINLAIPADRLPTPQATSLQLCFPDLTERMRRSGVSDSAVTSVSSSSPDAAAASHDGGAARSSGYDADRLRDAIAARIVASLRGRLGRFVRDPHVEAAALADETRSVCWTLGRPVEAHFADGSMMRGDAVALADDASLLIRTSDGILHTVRTADVGVLA